MIWGLFFYLFMLFFIYFAYVSCPKTLKGKSGLVVFSKHREQSLPFAVVLQSSACISTDPPPQLRHRRAAAIRHNVNTVLATSLLIGVFTALLADRDVRGGICQNTSVGGNNA